MEDDSAGAERHSVRHMLVSEHGPWDWTCARCGYAVKAGSRLEHQISNVQARGPLRAGGVLTGLGDVLERWRTAGRGAQSVATTAVVVAVVAIAAAWFIVRQASSDVPRIAATPRPTAVATAPRPLTGLSAIARATDAGPLVGRSVELDPVLVESVTGDVTFWVGSSRAERTFVILDETAQSELSVKVREGQLVRIVGTVERTPVEGSDLTAADEQSLDEEVLYVRARRVEVVEE